MKMIELIKYWLLGVYHFNAVCELIGSMHKALLLHTEIHECLKEKAVVYLSWPVTWISGFFHWISFSLERTTDKETMVIQSWVLGKIFSQKWKKLGRHFKENKWQCLLPMINLKQKLKFGKTCIWHHEFDNLWWLGRYAPHSLIQFSSRGGA